MRQLVSRILCGCLLSLLAGCGGNKTAETDEEDSGIPMSPQEKTYAAAVKPFVEAMVQGKYSAAYKFVSTRGRGSQTADEFAGQCAEDLKPYGKLTGFAPIHGVSCDPEDLQREKLPGESDQDYKLRLFGVNRNLGDLPAEVPAKELRASVLVECKVDPMSIPLHAGEEAYTPEDDTHCYLTIVLVEEAGALKVEFFFWRWPGMLD